MGLFLHTMLFPGGNGTDCFAALQRCAAEPEFFIQMEHCCWHTYEKGPAVLLNDGCFAYEIPADLSASLNVPILSLYTYDDDFWGYELWQNGTILDEFISVADYFGENEPPKPGDAQLIGLCFHVPPETVERYLVPWKEADIGKNLYAYNGDQAVIGDCWQIADFMDAIGFDYNQFDSSEKLPNQTSVPIREPVPEPETFQPSYPVRKCIDTPVLPNALTDQAYALRRAEALGPDASAITRLLWNGAYKDAIDLLTRAIAADPENPAFYLLRAFCWNQTESLSSRSRKPDMDRDLTKLLELEPDNVLALRGRCPTAATTARYKRHIEDLTRLIELDPEHQDLYLLDRAYRCHWTGEDAAARADLDEILRRGELWTVDLVYLCREFGLPGF